MPPPAEVLITGAGPTGLALAIWLTRLGVPVRIVDRLAAPELTSRAIGVQARTLEYYRQIQFAGEVTAAGWQAAATNLWVCGNHSARVGFLESGGDLSPFPYALVISQDDHEKLLIRRLSQMGVEIERETELVECAETGGVVQSLLKRSNGATEWCETPWLAGCDGARSTVREGLEIGFPGDTYPRRFYVADVVAAGPLMNGEINVAVDESDFVALFPLPGAGRARLVGMLPEAADGAGPAPEWKDVNQSVITGARLEVRRVNWFASYRVHHRVADRFRRGRIFLAGDAGHIHTPVGGQGLNTGVGDAVNLAWKLAAVQRGRAGVRLLDSYEPERIAFARKLVETTDRVFTGVTSARGLDRWARLHLVPWLLPKAIRMGAVRRFLFRAISQTSVHYRPSPLSAGRAGGVRGGDRLPWVKPASGETSDNFTPLESLDWQVHVYGNVSAEMRSTCTALKLALHEFPWRDEMKRAGLWRGAIYLVRPDGYVALADAAGRAQRVADYFAARRLKTLSP